MTSIANLNGMFKRRYGDYADLVPLFAILADQWPFREAERIGENYNFPVKVRRGHGNTWNGGANVGTTFNLNPAIAGIRRNAQIQGNEFVHRDTIAYGAASRGIEKGVAAFANIVDDIVLDMYESAAFNREMMLLYGQGSIGAIENASNPNFDVTQATWAPGIWSQMEGAEVDVYDTTLVTQRNTNAALVVSAIDPANTARTITLTGDAGDLAAIVDTDVFVPRGANGNWAAGLDVILSNTGTLFGIDAATYNLWQANQFAVGGVALTFAGVQGAVTTAVGRGLMEDVCVLVSPFTWTDLNNEQADLRRYVEDTSREITLGTTSIKYYGVQGGMMEIKPHPMVKAGEAFLYPQKRFRRIGSTDITFQLPNSPSGNPRFFRELNDQAGFELRNYFDQALICTHPARCVKLTGIVNDSL